MALDVAHVLVSPWKWLIHTSCSPYISIISSRGGHTRIIVNNNTYTPEKVKISQQRIWQWQKWWYGGGGQCFSHSIWNFYLKYTRKKYTKFFPEPPPPNWRCIIRCKEISIKRDNLPKRSSYSIRRRRSRMYMTVIQTNDRDMITQLERQMMGERRKSQKYRKLHGICWCR